jgi:O-acetyl-ADP-ribose deacetylase (regulator of RNase III)
MCSESKVGNLLESILELKLDGIQNAANGIGVMGAGIAGSIKKYGGKAIENDAFKICKEKQLEAGQSYSTLSGSLNDLGIKRIIHCITMKEPGGCTSYNIIRTAFRSAIKLAKYEKIYRFGCTALGTGIGHLDCEKVAEIMYKTAKEFSDIDIIFVDLNPKFINKIKSFENSYKNIC